MERTAVRSEIGRKRQGLEGQEEVEEACEGEKLMATG